MDRHLLIVANTFRVAGCVLGLPALLAFLYLTVGWIQLSVLPKPVEGNAPAINVQRDGIIGILAIGATIFGKAMGAMADLSLWLIRTLDVVALVLTLIGAMLFFTGRGLYGHATWARMIAGLAAFGLFAISFLAFTSMRRGPNFVSLAPLSASIYALWVLIRRFA